MANDIIDKVAEAFKVLELEQNVSLESENTQLSDVCEMDNEEQESINITQQKQISRMALHTLNSIGVYAKKLLLGGTAFTKC